MVQALNSKIDMTANATSYQGMAEYGKVMIGNNGFEYYNDRNVKKFIQIPWTEVNHVIVSVMFKGRWIPRFSIETNHNGTYSFAAKHPHALLRGMRVYIDPDRIVKSVTMTGVIKRQTKLIWHKIHKSQKAG